MAQEQTYNPEQPTRSQPSLATLAHVKKKLKMRRRHRRSNIRVAALNITSFLDMSFCLLMFLVLAAGSGSNEGTLTANMVRSGGSGTAIATEPPVPSTPVNLTVSYVSEDTYRIDFDPIKHDPIITSTFDDLTKLLTSFRSDHGGPLKEDNQIIIRPKASAPWQGVVSVFNAVVRAKYKNVNFARSEDE